MTGGWSPDWELQVAVLTDEYQPLDLYVSSSFSWPVIPVATNWEDGGGFLIAMPHIAIPWAPKRMLHVRDPVSGESLLGDDGHPVVVLAGFLNLPPAAVGCFPPKQQGAWTSEGYWPSA